MPAIGSRSVLYALAFACTVGPACDDAAGSGTSAGAGGTAGSTANAGSGGALENIGGSGGDISNGGGPNGASNVGEASNAANAANAGAGDRQGNAGGSGGSSGATPSHGPDPCAASSSSADAGLPALDGGLPSSPYIVQLVAGAAHNCVRVDNGDVRCWGLSLVGELGYGNTEQVRDASGNDGIVDIGGPVRDLAAAESHTCALLTSGAVRCWGSGLSGQLGYGNTENIGDDETPASAGDVDVGEPVERLWAGGDQTCVLTARGTLRCWGSGAHGELGNVGIENIGDDETPAVLGDIDVGGAVREMAIGFTHMCALLTNGAVRCWGFAGGGQLGYGNTEDIGDDETPASAGDVDVGGTVEQIVAGTNHTCVLLTTGQVRCWGEGFSGQLGHGNNVTIGDDETPASAGDVDVGARVRQIAAGSRHTCAILVSGRVQCWGTREDNRLGYGVDVFYDALFDRPSVAGPLDLCETVAQVDAGLLHTCALLDVRSVRCWGVPYESSAARAKDIPILFPPPD